MREEEAARYVNALCCEVEQRKDYLDHEPVRTLYFGGGTPSRLTPHQIGTVISAIRSTLGLDALEELTVECNPDDITPQYVSALKALGVNRISMGVQTFNDSLLRFMHRRHTAAQALEAVRICRESGITNISIDLMYGLPGQTLDMFAQDLKTALSAQVQHISSYCLSYEEDTPLHALKEQGKLQPVDDELCAQMFILMCQTLREGGFEHYEISNFCRPGFHSRHNSSYWDGTPYLGLGAAAHSYNQTSRQWSPSNLDTYLTSIENGTPTFDKETLSPQDRFNELIMLSLRTAQGLNLHTLPLPKQESLLTSAQPFIERGQLIKENSNLRLSESALFISDSIISTLFE